jgi:hypothetical protein
MCNVEEKMCEVVWNDMMNGQVKSQAQDLNQAQWKWKDMLELMLEKGTHKPSKILSWR